MPKKPPRQRRGNNFYPHLVLQSHFYFLAALGRKTNLVAAALLSLLLENLPLPDRLLAVIDDTPTKRYGPCVEGADIHRNPTPGPANLKYLYGHICVTLSLAVRHPVFGSMAFPLLAMLYVRKKRFPRFRGGETGSLPPN